MVWMILLIAVSFFSVIGIMEFLMCVLEFFAMRRTKSVKDIRIEATIEGMEPHVEFLLGSLSLKAERIFFRDLTTKVCVRDGGMDAETLERVREYVKENPAVYLIEKMADPR